MSPHQIHQPLDLLCQHTDLPLRHTDQICHQVGSIRHLDINEDMINFIILLLINWITSKIWKYFFPKPEGNYFMYQCIAISFNTWFAMKYIIY